MSRLSTIIVVTAGQCLAALTASAVNHVMWDTNVKSGDIFGRTSWKSWDGVNKTNDFYRLDIGAGDYHVTLSNMTFLGAIHPYVWNTRTSSLTLDGEGVVFRQDGSTDGSLVNDTGYVPFAVRQDYARNPVSLGSVPTTDSSILWSNALTRISYDCTEGEGGVFRWQLTRGYFSFAGVDADKSGYTLRIAYDSNTTKDRLHEYVFDGVETVVGNLINSGHSSNNLYAVRGGTLTHLGNMNIFDVARQHDGTNQFEISGGAVVKG